MGGSKVSVSKRTAGKSQVATQITSELLEEFRGYARGRGETFSSALERAMRRELAFPPPPVELAPLPDAARPAATRAKRRRGG